MVHLRIVSPAERTDEALEALESTPSVCNVVVLRATARRPDGDLILCDVAREDASVLVEDLKNLGLHETGSIAMELIDTELSAFADAAVRHTPGAPADAVVWEEVEARTEENVSSQASSCCSSSSPSSSRRSASCSTQRS